jgi:hypothetical protein
MEVTMSSFEETTVPSTHYNPPTTIPSPQEINPFPIPKEVKPMKLTIKTRTGTLEEYNLWFADKDPAEMDSMDLAKAILDISQIQHVMNQAEMDHRLSIMTVVGNDRSFPRARISMQTPLSKIEVIESLALINDNYLDARNAIKKFNEKVDKLGVYVSGEDDFSPLHAYSTRVVNKGSRNKREKNEDGEYEESTLFDYVSVNQMYVSEIRGEKCGWIVEFKTATINTRGQHYEKKWPGVLFMNKTDNGYRLMWKNKKTGGPIWGIGYAHMVGKKLVPMDTAIELTMLGLRDQLIREEDVLKILKYMPTDYRATARGLYPNGITQSDIYWIGGEMSTKKILNKAYMNNHGVTKKIFGDINSIKTLDHLRGAINLLIIARGFNPQVLEKLDLEIVTQYMRYSSTPLNRKHFKSFFRDFGYKDEYLLQMFAIEKDEDGNNLYPNGQQAVDASRMFAQIKGRNHRTAIKQHVARSRMNVEQIHDFVTAEFNKIKTENKKFPKTKFSKTFTEFDGKWIAEGIQMIVPKMTHDLVEWGATQNNCIGSYADRVYNGQTIIIGFKDAEGNWIGHAEIQNNVAYIGTVEVPVNGGMTQLLGKHNQPLPEETRKPIVKFLKDELKVTLNSHYWGQ